MKVASTTIVSVPVTLACYTIHTMYCSNSLRQWSPTFFLCHGPVETGGWGPLPSGISNSPLALQIRVRLAYPRYPHVPKVQNKKKTIASINKS